MCKTTRLHGLLQRRLSRWLKRDINDVETLCDMTLREFGKDTSAGGSSPLATESFENDPKWRIAQGIQLQRNSDETLSFEDELRALGNCEPCHR
jgi:hypothetical protein